MLIKIIYTNFCKIKNLILVKRSKSQSVKQGRSSEIVPGSNPDVYCSLMPSNAENTGSVPNTFMSVSIPLH
jgi:hypothetical protein